MSPLELFRRNQKVTMTFLILLAMIAFVVLPTVSQYMQSAGSAGSDPVLAEFNGVSLSASRVNTFTQNHYQTVQFLRKLAAETLKRGGTPKIFTVDPTTNQIQSVGINEMPSDEMSIRTMQFAAEAQDEGFALDDTSLSAWLEEFTDGTMSDREIITMLRRESNNRMGQYQLFDMLRKQLLSTLYARGSSVSVARGRFPLQSPLDHWKNFLKLNQKATINAYGVMVNDFIEQTDANPSETEIVAVYEAGKNRYPSEQSPEPGFRRRDTATFEYLLADLQSFRDAEVAKLSEDEIRAEYEKRKLGGAFQLPPDMKIEPESTETESTEAPAAASDETSAAPEAAPAAAEEMKTEPAKTDEPAGESTEEPAAPAPATSIENFSEELEAAGDLNAPTPAKQDQSQSAPENDGVRLVALQSDVATEAAETPAGETPAAETPAAEAEQQPAETTATDEAAATKTPEPRFRPFEEVRDQIAQTMVEEDARTALDQAVSKARTIMKQYSRARALYDADTSKAEPERPDLKSLATELGLSYRKIGPHDPVSLTAAGEPIVSSFEEGTALSQRGVPFTAMMFGVEGQVVKQEPFAPAVSVDLETQQTYLSWKIQEKLAYTPELDEVRDEVILAIRTAKARELAKQAAEAMAEKANSSGSIDDLIPDDRKDNYFKDLGPFSWLNMVGFGSVTIGNVEKLDSVDNDFMKAVFNAENGKYIVAENGPKRVYYIVKRTSLLPATSDLRAIFSQPTERMMARFMSDGSAGEIQEGFYNSVDEKTGFQRYQLAE
ncbi:MAG: hypothetical protein KDB00_25330 [Planctomycetales bacterium]|nr:hypothetical protein [Planctomycetales bacterium]